MKCVADVVRILVPRMVDRLGKHRLRVEIFFRNLIVACLLGALAEILNNAVAANEQILEEAAVLRAGIRLDWILTEA